MQTPKNFYLDRRTQGVLDVAKTTLDSITVGAGTSTVAIALFGEKSAFTVLIPALLTATVPIVRVAVSRVLALSVATNPISIEQSQTITPTGEEPTKSDVVIDNQNTAA